MHAEGYVDYYIALGMRYVPMMQMLIMNNFFKKWVWKNPSGHAYIQVSSVNNNS